MLFAPYKRFRILVRVTEWPPIVKIPAYPAYDIFSYNDFGVVISF